MKKIYSITQVKSRRKAFVPILFFSFLFLTNSSIAQWTRIGTGGTTNPAPSNSNHNRIAVAADGTPYMLFSNPNQSGKATVRKFNGLDWVSVGTEGFSLGAISHSNIEIDATGTPYVSFADAGVTGSVRVMKFNGTSWVGVGPATRVTPDGVTSLSMKLGSTGLPYICYPDSANGTKVTVLRFNGSAWQALGSAGFTATSAGKVSMAIDGNDNVYVAFSEKNAFGYVSMLKYNGTAWSLVGNARFLTQPLEFEIGVDPNAVPYFVYSHQGNAGRIAVYKYNGTAWVVVGATGVSSGFASTPSIAFIGTKPVISYGDVGAFRLVAKEFDGTNWNLVGGANVSGSYWNIANIALDGNNNIYVGGRENPSYTGGIIKYCTSIPTISLTYQTICGPAFTTITPNVSAGEVRWYTSLTSPLLTIGSSFVTPTLTSSMTYYAQAVSLGCASARRPVGITVNPTPVINTTFATPGTICGSGTASLSAFASHGTISWYVTPSGGFAQGSGSPFVTSTLTSTRNYYVESVANGCKSTPRTLVTVPVVARPTITSTMPASRCGSGIVTLSATGSSGSTLSWFSVSAAGTALATTASFTTPTLNTSTSFFVEATSGTCKSNRTSVAVTINPSVTPSVSILASQTTICAGTLVTFTAIPVNGGPLPTFQWRQNGNIISGANASTFSTSGLTNGAAISVVMTSNGSCTTNPTVTSAGITISVTTSVTPSVNVASSQTSICPGTPVTFTATPTNGGTSPVFYWKLNGTTISGATGSIYTSSTLGNNSQISATLVSNNACASSTTAQSNVVTITHAAALQPMVAISASRTAICTGNAVTFLASATHGGTVPTYIWSVNGNTVSGTSSSFTSSTLQPNSQVRAVLKSNELCASPTTATSNIITITVSSFVTPSISITSSQQTICAGTFVAFTAQPANGGTSPVYQWKVNGANVGTNSTIFSTASLTQGAVVTCQLVSNDPCASVSLATSNAITMTVNPSIVPSVSVSASQTNICTGATVVFSAVPSNGGTSPQLRWRLNGNTISGATSNTFTTSTLANNDVVSAVLISNATCATTQIAVSNNIILSSTGSTTPTISISTPQTAICSGASVTFTATVVNGGTSPAYQWKINGSTTGSNSATFTTNQLADSNIVQCVLTSTAACVTNATASSNGILMSLGASVSPSIVISASTSTVCSGVTVTFDASASNEGQQPVYQWKRNGNVIPDANTATYASNSLVTGDQISCTVLSSDVCASPRSVTSNFIPITVNQTPSNLVTVNDNVLTAIESGAVYYWGDCIAQAGIPDANSQTYIASNPGQYVVLVEKNGCRDTSTCYTVTQIVVTSNKNADRPGSGIQLYPNPFEESFTIQSAESFAYELTDAYGKVVSQGNSDKSLTIDTWVPSGVYVLQVKSQGKSTYTRIVKK